MMPVCSCSTPGRKPGTSTKVRTGTLKASQVRTKRAAFSLAAEAGAPASTQGRGAAGGEGRGGWGRGGRGRQRGGFFPRSRGGGGGGGLGGCVGGEGGGGAPRHRRE